VNAAYCCALYTCNSAQQ